MLDENDPNVQGTQVMSPSALAHKPPQDEKEDIVKFDSDGRSSSPGTVILVVCALIAITATVFFWLMQRDVTNKVAAAKDQLVELDSQLARSDLAETDQRARSFKESVNALQAATSQRYAVSVLLPELYKKINKNVQVLNLSIDEDGKVDLDAVTASYKAAGEQAITLKEWKIGTSNVLDAVDIVNISETVEDGTASVPFTLSAKLNRSVSLK